MINSVLGGDIYNKFFVYATSVKFGKLREILLRVYRGQVFSSHTVYGRRHNYERIRKSSLFPGSRMWLRLLAQVAQVQGRICRTAGRFSSANNMYSLYHLIFTLYRSFITRPASIRDAYIEISLIMDELVVFSDVNRKEC